MKSNGTNEAEQVAILGNFLLYSISRQIRATSEKFWIIKTVVANLGERFFFNKIMLVKSMRCYAASVREFSNQHFSQRGAGTGDRSPK